MDKNRKHLILVIDDSDANRYFFAKTLSGAGHEVIEAKDGVEGTYLFHTHYPDLVLLDVNLPKMNGYEVCSELKAEAKGARTPIILISASFTKEDDHHKGYEGGADAYLVAPLNPNILINTVRSWLRAYRVDQDRERLQKLTRTILENAASCFFMMDDKGIATYMNPAAQIVTGFKLSELGEKPLHDYVHHHRPDGTPYPMAECPLGETYQKKAVIREQEEIFIRKDGSFFPVIYSIAPVMVGDVLTGSVLEFRDVSESKKNQLEMLNSVEHLRRERDLREQFIATLTHDLRAPLTAAKMSAFLINRKPDDTNTIQKLAGRIAENMDRADQMILDLLDADLINAGEKLSLKMSAVDLNLIVKDTLVELSSVHGERFHYQEVTPIEGHWNASGLRRILENLCSNAIKYGEAYRPVTVSCLIEGKSLRLQVHNEGFIPEEEQKSLFNKYSRSQEARKSGQKGWGLGLTLVKGIAEAHGGKVDVVSNKENGTVFSVELPLDAR